MGRLTVDSVTPEIPASSRPLHSNQLIVSRKQTAFPLNATTMACAPENPPMLRRLSRTCSLLSQVRKQFGTTAALQALTDRIGRKLCGLRVTQVVWLDLSATAELADDDPRFTFRFLTAAEVRHHAADPDLDLSDDLAERIENGRDLCFAALEGDRLAAYGWYALECIEPEHNFHIPMSYASDTAYMYKGFTHSDYRGLRLHGRIMGLALRALAGQEVTHLVSTVNWTNWPSLRSCDRLGYERIGKIVALSGGHWIVRTPRAARRRGVQFGRKATRREQPIAVETLPLPTT